MALALKWTVDQDHRFLVAVYDGAYDSMITHVHKHKQTCHIIIMSVLTRNNLCKHEPCTKYATENEVKSWQYNTQITHFGKKPAFGALFPKRHYQKGQREPRRSPTCRFPWADSSVLSSAYVILAGVESTANLASRMCSLTMTLYAWQAGFSTEWSNWLERSVYFS